MKYKLIILARWLKTDIINLVSILKAGPGSGGENILDPDLVKRSGPDRIRILILATLSLEIF